jgi:hypothetical protein
LAHCANWTREAAGRLVRGALLGLAASLSPALTAAGTILPSRSARVLALMLRPFAVLSFARV